MSIELTVIKFALTEEGRKYIPHLSKHMFSNDVTKFMFSELSKVHTDTKGLKIPTLSELKVRLYERYDKAEDKQKIRRYLRLISNEDITLEFSRNVVTDLIQKSQMRNFLQNIIPQLDSMEPMNVSAIKQEINKIVDTSTIEGVIPISLDDHSRREWNSHEMVPTFSGKLNEYLLGGLAPGELGLIQANPGIGKTLTSINMAFAAAITGHTVWFVTLDEMGRDIATRMDMKLFTYNGKKEWSRNIHIIDFSDGAKTADLLTLLETQDTPSLIIVDGTDDFMDPGAGREDGERQRIGRIYKSLRRITRRKNNQVPMWITSQSTANSESKLKKGMFDVTENKIVKAGESSVVISVNQTEEESDAGIARLFVSKIRRPCGPGKSITLLYSRDNQSLKDEDGVFEDEVINSLNNSKRSKKTQK